MECLVAAREVARAVRLVAAPEILAAEGRALLARQLRGNQEGSAAMEFALFMNTCEA